MVIESRSRSSKGSRSVMSTLSLVDLAGSESVRLANTHGQRQIEGGFINKSLLTLGKVVSMLTEEGKSGVDGYSLAWKQGQGCGTPCAMRLGGAAVIAGFMDVFEPVFLVWRPILVCVRV